MKIILSIGVLLSSMYGQNLTMAQIAQINHYNHSLSGRLAYQERLKRIATIKLDKLYTLVERNCNGTIKSTRLQHSSWRLFYVVTTGSCFIKIDALDGSIMEKR